MTVVLAYRLTREPMPSGPLTDEERAREPRSLALVAWFDGWAQALGIGNNNADHPRRLDAAEQAEWRDGHRTGVRDRPTP